MGGFITETFSIGSSEYDSVTIPDNIPFADNDVSVAVHLSCIHGNFPRCFVVEALTLPHLGQSHNEKSRNNQSILE